MTEPQHLPWCDPSLCTPGYCHRTPWTTVDLGEATVTLSVSQWRNGYPDELLPGWQPPHLTYSIEHHTETVDDGYGPGEPIIIRESDPHPLHVMFRVADPGAARRFLTAQTELLALLAQAQQAGQVTP